MFNINFSSDLGTVQHSHLSAASNAENLIVILQVFRNEDSGIDATPVQENIFKISERYVNAAGVRLVCVEHAENQVPAPPPEMTFSDLVKSTSVSAAVRKLVGEYPNLVEAWGVDDLGLIDRSYKAMHALKDSTTRQSRFFPRLCNYLYAAQSRYYTPMLAELRRGTIGMYREETLAVDFPLTVRASLMNRIAEAVGLDLEQFPVYSTFSTSASMEHSIDFERAKAQREKFISRVGTKALSWIDSVEGGHTEIDQEMTALVIRSWMTSTKLSPSELEHNLKLRGLENVLKEAADWLQSWLLESAIQIRLTGRGLANQSEIDYYNRLAQLEPRERSTTMQLRDFHRYMDYRQIVEKGITPISLISELRECEKALIEKFDQPAVTRLSRIEDLLNHMYFSLQLEQTPLEAEVIDISPGRLQEVVQDLFDLLGETRIPKEIREDLKFLDQLLSAAVDFPRLSRSRGQIMIRRTLDILRDRREDRALLVVGGFHQRAVIRELERNRRVSWQVIVPKIDFDAVKQKKGLEPQ